jgi:hypothetical protein
LAVSPFSQTLVTIF